MASDVESVRGTSKKREEAVMREGWKRKKYHPVNPPYICPLFAAEEKERNVPQHWKLEEFKHISLEKIAEKTFQGNWKTKEKKKTDH